MASDAYTGEGRAVQELHKVRKRCCTNRKLGVVYSIPLLHCTWHEYFRGIFILKVKFRPELDFNDILKLAIHRANLFSATTVCRKDTCSIPASTLSLLLSHCLLIVECYYKLPFPFNLKNCNFL